MKATLLVSAVVLVLGVSPALAGVDTLEPLGGPFIKTPALQESDNSSVALQIHFANTHQNWAGIGFTLNWDSHEVNFVGINASPGWTLTDAGFFSPPVSGSSPGYYLPTLWHPNATGTGNLVFPSSTTFPGTIVFHVHNSSAGQNSDIDIDFLNFAGNSVPSPFNIFHATAASVLLTFGPSDLLYVPVSNPVPGAWQPLAPGAGTWIHLTDTTTIPQVLSAFYGKTSSIAAVGGIGVEHVPEPASAALLLGGLGLLVAARRLGARR